MTTTINASPSNGIVQTADGSGVMKLQSNGVTTNALAWVNFDGSLTSPITPRANYNCSSVTKNATGDFTLNFTSALTDANYCLVGTTSVVTTGAGAAAVVELYDASAGGTNPTTSAARIYVHRSGVSAVSQPYIMVSVFGN